MKQKIVFQLPFPWFDKTIMSLSRYNEKFKKHYLKKIEVSRKNICSICGKNGTTHFHHIIPRSELGLNTISNLMELCPSCHKKSENGLIELGPGKYFVWGMKKKRKIERKRYISNVSDDEFFKIHLEIDSVIKYLIKQNMNKRLEEKIIEWKERKIVINYDKNKTVPQRRNY